MAIIIGSPTVIDSLIGTNEDDRIFLLPNIDSLTGLEFVDALSGNDTILAGNAVSADGGLGDDSFFGSEFDDTLYGGSRLNSTEAGGFDPEGNDFFSPGLGDDLVFGGAGTDTISYPGFGPVTVTLPEGDEEGMATGANGNDRIFGIENIDGSSGDDDLFGNSEPNIIRGALGSDRIFGNDGNDSLWGGGGDDTLNGGNGNNVLRGGNRRDTFDIRQGTNNIRGGRGTDTITADNGPSNSTFVQYDVVADLALGFATLIFADGSRQENTLRSIEGAIGGNGDDTLAGNGSGNFLTGNDGDDELFGRSGDDVLAGNAGEDFLEGNQGNDAVSGGSEDDTIDGGSGNDTLIGGEGADSIRGGPGSDLMNGGSQSDTFLWQAGDLSSTAEDRLIGFAPIGDTIRLSGIYEPGTEAEDVIIVSDLGRNTGLTLDLRTALPGGLPDFNNFLVLQNFDAANVDLDFWQNIGTIEFV